MSNKKVIKEEYVKVKLMGEVFKAYECPEFLIETKYKNKQSPGPNYVLAQLDADAPYRWFSLADNINEAKGMNHLFRMLEEISGQKVQIKQNLKEVKRTKMTEPYQVKNYVRELLRKYNLSPQSRMVMKGKIILVEAEVAEIDELGYKKVSFELIENGFRQKGTKKINGKSYINMTDDSTKIIVLLPFFDQINKNKI